MFLQWKDEYRLGHDLIDFDHQILFNLTNELHGRVERSEGTEQIAITIDCLLEYVQRHFAREEEIFLDSDYPNSEKHIARHREMEKTVLDIKSLYENNPGALDAAEVLKFLKKWLTRHILKMDREFFPYINR